MSALSLHDSSGVSAVVSLDRHGVLCGTPSPRTYMSCVTWRSRLYLFGGFGDNRGRFCDTFCYTPALHAWQLLNCSGTLPPPVYLHSAVLYGDCMFVFAGSVGADTNELFQLDLITATWTKVTDERQLNSQAQPLPSQQEAAPPAAAQVISSASPPRTAAAGAIADAGATSSAVGSKSPVLASASSAASSARAVPSASASLSSSAPSSPVDLAAVGGSSPSVPALSGVSDSVGSVSSVVACTGPPSPRYGHAALVLGDRMLVTGGCRTAAAYNSDTHFFHFRTRTWSRGPPLPVPLAYHALLVHNGVAHSLFGSMNGTQYSPHLLYALQEGGANGGSWLPVQTHGVIPPPSCGAAVCMLDADTITVFGGFTATGHHNELYRLDLRTRTWELLPVAASSKPLPRAYLAMATVDQRQLLLFGGFDGRGCVSDFRRITVTKPVQEINLAAMLVGAAQQQQQQQQQQRVTGSIVPASNASGSSSSISNSSNSSSAVSNSNSNGSQNAVSRPRTASSTYGSVLSAMLAVAGVASGHSSGSSGGGSNGGSSGASRSHSQSQSQSHSQSHSPATSNMIPIPISSGSPHTSPLITSSSSAVSVPGVQLGGSSLDVRACTALLLKEYCTISSGSSGGSGSGSGSSSSGNAVIGAKELEAILAQLQTNIRDLVHSTTAAALSTAAQQHAAAAAAAAAAQQSLAASQQPQQTSYPFDVSRLHDLEALGFTREHVLDCLWHMHRAGKNTNNFDIVVDQCLAHVMTPPQHAHTTPGQAADDTSNGASSASSISKTRSASAADAVASLTPTGDETPDELRSKLQRAVSDLSELHDSKQCKICLDAPLSVCLQPCSHLVACSACARDLFQRGAMKECPLCRRRVTGHTRVFWE